jgi:hypothetical protein
MGLGRYFYLMRLLFVRKEKRNGDSSAVFRDFKTVTGEILHVNFTCYDWNCDNSDSLISFFRSILK